MPELKKGWYRCGQKFHYFRDGEFGQGFLSFCGVRNFQEGPFTGLNNPINVCRFCLGKLTKEKVK